jgi:hypothetical protein
MREIRGNIWEWSHVVIPTNLSLRADGNSVMGAGLARQASVKYSREGLAGWYGRWVKEFGGELAVWVARDGRVLFLLPVKDDWRERASLKMIDDGLTELRERVEGMDRRGNLDEKVTIAIPRLGGGLNWDEVKGLVERRLYSHTGMRSRFAVVDMVGSGREDNKLDRDIAVVKNVQGIARVGRGTKRCKCGHYMHRGECALCACYLR